MAIAQEKCEKNYLKLYLKLLLNLKEMAKKYFRLLNKTGTLPETEVPRKKILQ